VSSVKSCDVHKIISIVKCWRSVLCFVLRYLIRVAPSGA